MPFLEKEFPQLAASYRDRYQGRAFVTQTYRKRLDGLVQRLREKHGMMNRYERYQRQGSADANPEAQLGLFASIPEGSRL
jgi:hypothetical protein